MKKFSKSLVFVSVGLLLIAVLLLVASALSFMFDENHAFFVEFNDHVAIALYETEISTDEPHIEKLSTVPLVFAKEMRERLEFESLDSLVINANNADIEIKVGDKNSISTFWYEDETIEPMFSYNDSQLRVTCLDATYNNEVSSKIMITLTEDVSPSIDIKTKYGDITIDNINVEEINLNLAGNDVYINNVIVNSVLRILSYESKIKLNDINSGRCVLYLNQGGVTMNTIKTGSLYSTNINSSAIIDTGKIENIKLVLDDSILKVKDYDGQVMHVNFKGKIDLENLKLESLKLETKKESVAIIENINTNCLNIKLSDTTLFVKGELKELKTDLYKSTVNLQLKNNDDANLKTDLYKSTVTVNDRKIDKNIDLKVDKARVNYELKLINSKVNIYE